ncbi:MAG: hypothetical protein ACHQII_03065, partial [Bacteroidia bacterium]
MLRNYLLIFTLFITQLLQAQKSLNDDGISSYNYDSLNMLIIKGINAFRLENGLDSIQSNDILIKASVISSSAMAKNQNLGIKDLPKTTAKNLKKAGATVHGQELVILNPLGKGINQLPPAVITKAVLEKWTLGKKEKDILLNPANTYIGLNCVSDAGDRRVYISAMFGNYQSFNDGVKHKAELKVPFNTKSKKLKDPDPRNCKNCTNFKDYENLHNGLSVEDGKIYLEYSNIRYLKKLLKRPTDGLAVDIVQKEQYSQADYNIMDNNMRNKGVMTKVIKKDKLFAKNLVPLDDPKKKNKKPNKLRVEMGVFPKEIGDDYELNLLVIQNGFVCKTVLRSYMEYTDNEASTPIEMLPMTESLAAKKPPYEPKSESALLTFNIPFAKNKSEFKQEDVKPFVDAMHEPDFNIDGLYIYAYSSIEGDSVTNANLQRKRAESVTKVLEQMQHNKISPIIVTNDSWGLFQLEMEDGKYDYLTKLSKHEAINKINHTKGLAEEMESSLAKERFAQVVMDVTYDISGAKEEKFCVVQFNRVAKTGNTKQAYRIMDYIAEKVKQKKYAPASLSTLEIPTNDAKLVGLQMNKIYYNYVLNNKVVSDEDYKTIQELQKIDGTNNTINYNALFCKIQIDSVLGSKSDQTDMQNKIDALYKSDIPKKLVDGLNIEWQFK